MRTHVCSEVTEALDGQTVTVCGWVDRARDLGGLVFIRLRDYSDLLQVIVEPDNKPAFAQAEKLHNEYCVQLTGRVRMRPEDQWNPDMATGKVELVADEVNILSRSAPLPLLMNDDDGEEIRLKYRYLDLRRPRMQRNLRLRAALTRAIRRHLDARDFVDAETPILTRATPEGARDYVVPSRVRPGSFFALPQSPQLFKQILMMGGLDRYYQIARCFRDEDLRADRQPEFTQLDIEMSFVDEADVQSLAEGMIRQVFADVLDVELPDPFPHMSWHEAMTRYGSDKPDLRVGMELITVCDPLRHVEFKVFSDPANDPESRVAALCVPGGAALSRRQIDEYTDYVARYGARGLAWMKVNDAAAGMEGVQSPIAKFLDEKAVAGLLEATGAADGDMLFFGADKKPVVSQFLGALRLRLARDLDLFEDGWKPLWVVDFPMFEYDEEDGRHYALHHPFTAPADDEAMRDDPGTAASRAYDMVLNGAEIGGGSIRINDPDMQQAVFDVLGIDEQEAGERFGFLLEALRYGCPPHGGIAFGIDRIAALMAGENSIREVIAFPKTTNAACLLTGAPAPVDAKQLDELKLELKKDP